MNVNDALKDYAARELTRRFPVGSVHSFQSYFSDVERVFLIIRHAQPDGESAYVEYFDLLRAELGRFWAGSDVDCLSRRIA